MRSGPSVGCIDAAPSARRGRSVVIGASATRTMGLLSQAPRPPGEQDDIEGNVTTPFGCYRGPRHRHEPLPGIHADRLAPGPITLLSRSSRRAGAGSVSCRAANTPDLNRATSTMLTCTAPAGAAQTARKRLSASATTGPHVAQNSAGSRRRRSPPPDRAVSIAQPTSSATRRLCTPSCGSRHHGEAV